MITSFNPNLLELIPASHLDTDIGGEFTYEFEPHTTWLLESDRRVSIH